MARNIVTGKSVEYGMPTAEYLSLRERFWLRAVCSQKGFSLLELMIAMFILIVLLSIALPAYQRSVQHARETVLKENLWQMRRSIDQFQADKGKLPQSLQDLVEQKYLREVPRDPIKESQTSLNESAPTWNEVQGEDTTSPDKEQGLVDVKSTAEGEDSEGMAYTEY